MSKRKDYEDVVTTRWSFNDIGPVGGKVDFNFDRFHESHRFCIQTFWLYARHGSLKESRELVRSAFCTLQVGAKEYGCFPAGLAYVEFPIVNDWPGWELYCPVPVEGTLPFCVHFLYEGKQKRKWINLAAVLIGRLERPVV